MMYRLTQDTGNVVVTSDLLDMATTLGDYADRFGYDMIGADFALLLSRIEPGESLETNFGLVEVYPDSTPEMLRISCDYESAEMTKEDLIDLLPQLFEDNEDCPEWDEWNVDSAARAIWNLEPGESFDIGMHHIKAL
jgi:hypothetical protein